ncbi:MAG: hypothetical protein O2877_02090 [bacterium]|nr:hypothetical protein [bacterium]
MSFILTHNGKPTRLQPGDQVLFGSTYLMFQRPNSDSAFCEVLRVGSSDKIRLEKVNKIDILPVLSASTGLGYRKVPNEFAQFDIYELVEPEE